ncbi:MAG: hypothetical protein SFU55_10475 [Methylophilus sp.]|nr:hypothetical protein [Methylophilus sp.]
MKNSVLRFLLVIATIPLIVGCIGALAPVAVVGGQKSGAFSESEDDLYKLIARQYGIERSQFKISDIDQQKHWNTTETYFNVSFNTGRKLRCQVSSALGSNGDMALCDEAGTSATKKCNALLKAAGKC